MAELKTLADYAERLRAVCEHRDRLVTENARIPRLEGRVAKAEEKAKAAEAKLAGVGAERDEALRQLAARDRVIRDKDTQIQGTQNELETLRKQSDALETLGIR